METAMDLLWSAIQQEDEVGVVGIHGTAGVGKSRLLRLLTEKLQQQPEGDQAQDRETRDFDVVLTIEASEESTEQSILADIARQLGVVAASGGSNDSCSLAGDVLAALDEKSFVIILDGLWEPVSLGSVGIPDPVSGRPGYRKLVVSSRIKHVLTQMGAAAVYPLEVLSQSASWDLFLTAAGKDLDENPELQPVKEVAETLVIKLGGIPLALQSVGEAMSSERSLAVWEQANTDMDTAPWDVPGMKPVLESLKRTYDNLRLPKVPDGEADGDRKTELLQSCLEYICLFGKSFSTYRSTWIDYWVGEGMIDGFDSLEEATAIGEGLIETLVASGLVGEGYFRSIESEYYEVEDGQWFLLTKSNWRVLEGDTEFTPTESSVKLNDPTFAMILWIRSLKGRRWCIKPIAGLEEAPPAEEWEAADRVSLLLNCVGELPSDLHCPELTWLSLWRNGPIKIPEGFFRHMPNLTMLELSGTLIKTLPPSIGDLSGLLYLDLQTTRLGTLPKELGNLTKLRFLNLDDTPILLKVPKGVFSKLQELQVLRMRDSYTWAERELRQGEAMYYRDSDEEAEESDGGAVEDDGLAGVEELLGLMKLKQVDIRVKTIESLRTLFGSPGPKEALRSVAVNFVTDTLELDLVSDMGHTIDGPTSIDISFCEELQRLALSRSDANPEADTYFRRLKYLTLSNLFTISWMDCGPITCLANLRELKITECYAMEALFDWGLSDEEEGVESETRHSVVFPCLEVLELSVLLNLESICRRGKLQVPTLRKLKVKQCYKLKDLSLDESSGMELENIQGSVEWWNALEWSDDELKTRFEPFFEEVPEQSGPFWEHFGQHWLDQANEKKLPEAAEN